MVPQLHSNIVATLPMCLHSPALPQNHTSQFSQSLGLSLVCYGYLQDVVLSCAKVGTVTWETRLSLAAVAW